MNEEGKSFTTSKEAKAAGWFSRRNETREASEAARDRYKATHGKEARRRRAAERERG